MWLRVEADRRLKQIEELACDAIAPGSSLGWGTIIEGDPAAGSHGR